MRGSRFSAPDYDDRFRRWQTRCAQAAVAAEAMSEVRAHAFKRSSPVSLLRRASRTRSIPEIVLGEPRVLLYEPFLGYWHQ